ncbi:DUF6460 domain-containing protein [Pyruvatibacter sp.]
MNNIFGGSPPAVILKIVIASVCIGLLLDLTGMSPESIWEDAFATIGDIWGLAIGWFAWAGKFLVMGAIIVVPIWIVVRLFDVLFGGSKSS